MISLRKLEKMPPRAKARKVAALLRIFVRQCRQGSGDHWRYWAEILRMGARLAEDGRSLPDPTEADPLRSTPPSSWDLTALARAADEIAWKLLADLGIDAADWNLYAAPDDARLPPERPLPIRLYLDQIRSPYNLGAIFRTALAFGVERIVLSPGCPSVDHPRCRRTAMGAVDLVPWERAELPPDAAPLFGLEPGGVPLDRFSLPDRGMAALGSEEWGLRPETLQRCRASLGVVAIPLHGAKASLNVAAAAAILLYAWAGRLSSPRTWPGSDP